MEYRREAKEETMDINPQKTKYEARNVEIMEIE